MTRGEKIFIGIFVSLLVIAIVVSVVIKTRKENDKWREVSTDDNITSEVSYSTESTQQSTDYTFHYPETENQQHSTTDATTQSTTEQHKQNNISKEESYWEKMKYMQGGTSDDSTTIDKFDEESLVSMTVRGMLQGYGNSCPFLLAELKSVKIVDDANYEVMSSDIDLKTHIYTARIINVDTDDMKNISISYEVDIDNQLITKFELVSIEDYEQPTTEVTTTEAPKEEYWVMFGFYVEDENYNYTLAEEAFITYVLQGVIDNHLYDCIYATDEIKKLDLTSYDFKDNTVDIATNEITLKDGTIFEYDYIEEPSLQLTKLQVKEGN